jgi:hypothetical protein
MLCSECCLQIKYNSPHNTLALTNIATYLKSNKLTAIKNKYQFKEKVLENCSK